MVRSEREMIRPLLEDKQVEEKFTSLQPTYEDSVPPDPDDDWEQDQD